MTDSLFNTVIVELNAIHTELITIATSAEIYGYSDGTFYKSRLGKVKLYDMLQYRLVKVAHLF